MLVIGSAALAMLCLCPMASPWLPMASPWLNPSRQRKAIVHLILHLPAWGPPAETVSRPQMLSIHYLYRGYIPPPSRRRDRLDGRCSSKGIIIHRPPSLPPPRKISSLMSARRNSNEAGSSS